MEKVYVIGHKNPDTDTVVSAISASVYLNKLHKTDRYVPAVTGKFNTETEYVFKKFTLEKPELLEDASGKRLFLVDHNESSQIVDGFEKDNILGFIDHHKINFKSDFPVDIVNKPWGSSNTIVYYLCEMENIDLPDKIKPAMLCAILSDTVILKSPTTTDMDRTVVKQISDEMDIDYRKLGVDLFKAKARVASKTAEEIIKNDFKQFDFSGKKVGIGQIETPDLSELDNKIPKIVEKLSDIKDEEGYHTMVLMLTDIMKEGSKLIVVSDELEKVAGIYGIKIEDNVSSFMEGVMSRKKQVAPPLSERL